MIEQELKQKIQQTMLDLRNNVKINNYTEEDMSNCVMTEIRKGYLADEIVDRLIIFLRGTGCYMTRKQGGCTFCGFYNATNYTKRIPDHYFMKQIENALEKYKDCMEKYPIICIYNDGSLLCEEEISQSIIYKIFEKLEQIPTVKKVVLEARVDDITEEKIREIRKIYHKELEISVGFESSNEEIRELCMNKYFSNERFESIVELCKRYNAEIIPLMILKPAFLSEKEAIDDYISSLKYLDKFNLSRIDMEIMTIEKNTLNHILWKQGYYQLPKLWSVIYILQRKKALDLKTRVYISPMHYSVEAECMSSNCKQCTDLVVRYFNQYNESENPEIFNKIQCDCKKEWIQLINEKVGTLDLHRRVEYIMNHIKIDESMQN